MHSRKKIDDKKTEKEGSHKYFFIEILTSISCCSFVLSVRTYYRSEGYNTVSHKSITFLL